MDHFNGSAVKEIKTVIEYVLIQFRDGNQQLKRTMRKLPGEVMVFPELSSQTTIGNHTVYRIVRGWKDVHGNPAPSVVLNTNTIYYADELSMTIPNNIDIKMLSSTNQELCQIDISSPDTNVKFNSASSGGCTFVPTFSYFTNGATKMTRVKLTVQNFTYSSGVNRTYSPEFVIYGGSQLTEMICKATIQIRVYTTGQPTGD